MPIYYQGVGTTSGEDVPPEGLIGPICYVTPTANMIIKPGHGLVDGARAARPGEWRWRPPPARHPPTPAGSVAVRQAAGLRSARRRPRRGSAPTRTRGGECRAGAAAAANGDARDAPVPYRGRGQPPPPPPAARTRAAGRRRGTAAKPPGTVPAPGRCARARGNVKHVNTSNTSHPHGAGGPSGHTRRRRRRPRPAGQSAQSLDPVWAARAPAGTPASPRRPGVDAVAGRAICPAREGHSAAQARAGGAADGGGGAERLLGVQAGWRAARDAGGGLVGDVRGGARWEGRVGEPARDRTVGGADGRAGGSARVLGLRRARVARTGENRRAPGAAELRRGVRRGDVSRRCCAHRGGCGAGGCHGRAGRRPGQRRAETPGLARATRKLSKEQFMARAETLVVRKTDATRRPGGVTFRGA